MIHISSPGGRALLAGALALCTAAAFATPPQITISSPPDGSVFVTGTPIQFTASAYDYEDGDLTDQIYWSTDATGTFGYGGSVQAVLPPGEHFVFANVVDRSGQLRSDAVIVIVFGDGPPAVSITSPANGAAFEIGTPVTLVATALDYEDGDLTDRITWFSNIDGALGVGSPLTVSLSAGTHLIGAYALDHLGNVGVDQIELFVVSDVPPDVVITSPMDGSEFEVGTPIQFSATAFDFEQGDLTDLIVWTSSLDGAIGYGGSFTTVTLTPGEHVVTASVEDIGGAVGSDLVIVFIVGNTPPTLVITQPLEGSQFARSDLITFSATAADFEDGDLSAAILWASSIDGVLGTGATITAHLSPGTHLIQAAILDSGGASAVQEVGITVTNDCPADLNLDHLIDLQDVAILQVNFGQSSGRRHQSRYRHRLGRP